MPDIDYAAGLLWYFVFLYSTVCHEAAHAWAALKLGDDTAYLGGQVSLDPIPHIRREPIGMVLAPIVSFIWYAASGRPWMIGWASAPYDPEWAGRNPRSAAWMAMAGPAANLIIMLAAGIAIRAGLVAGWFTTPSGFFFADFVIAAQPGRGMELLATSLGILFALNLLSVCFNLLPLPPLDGSAIPLFFLRGRHAQAYQEFMWTPTVQIMGFLIAFNGFGRIFTPILTFAVNLLYQGHTHYNK